MLLLLACEPVSLEAVVVDSPAPGFDTALEQVPGPEEGLCEVELECPDGIPDEPKADCTMTVRDGYGVLAYEGGAGVETRGRSSSGFPKKQYSVELRDAEGEVEVDLLDMGAESDWVLNGAWIDRALLRNKVGYDLFQSWGGAERYAPESRTCWLTLNGEDWGIYFLGERIKRDGSRIDLPAEGSFVAKLDDRPGLVENALGNGHWRLVHPPAPTADEEQALQTWFEGWFAADGDAVFDYLDRDSAIDFLLLQEFMKNNDAYYLSVHLWRGPEGPAFFAPWDLDLSFGQPTYNDNVSPEGWLLYRPAWVKRLVAAPGFVDAMATRWQQLRQGELADEAILARVEAQIAVTAPHVERNFEIWPWDEIDFLGGYLPQVEDHEQELANVRAWIPQRLAWIDAHVDSY